MAAVLRKLLGNAGCEHPSGPYLRFWGASSMRPLLQLPLNPPYANKSDKNGTFRGIVSEMTHPKIADTADWRLISALRS